jgi:uncharacterized coiled-coil protein SlyX
MNITFEAHERVVVGLTTELSLYSQRMQELETKLKAKEATLDHFVKGFTEQKDKVTGLTKHIEQQKTKCIEKAELVRHIKADVKRAMKSKSAKTQQKILALALQNLEVL